ncbi:MAG: hypothetical protein VB066_11990 [Paludibacter sp.]|nr:hypothetical protein [Paludibacter sp.]
MRKHCFYLILLFICTSGLVQAQQHVSFFEEHIDFALDTDYFVINGIYSFHNTTDRPVNQQISFPFADKISAIDSIRILNLNEGTKIPFNKAQNFVQFNLTLSPGDTVDVNIYYRQKVAIVNKYIITSTQTWGKPLDKAVYTLTTDKCAKIKSFSFAPDSIEERDGKRLYIWRKQHFMPVTDFEIVIDE